MISEIEKARGEYDYQWALQLVDRLINLSESDRKLNGLKAAILREHAVAQIKCPTRHYYIRSAFELEPKA